MMSNHHDDERSLREFFAYVKEYAVGLFREGDDGLYPKVLLIGIPDKTQDSHETQDIWLLQDSQLKYTQAYFAPVAGVQVSATDGTNANKVTYRTELRNIILSTLNDESENHVSFCSRPVAVGVHMACLILQMRRLAYKRHSPPGADTTGRRSDTFLACLAQEYLKESEYCLLQISRGYSSEAVIEKSPYDLRRRAGRALLRPVQESEDDLVPLFEHINAVSGLRYEGLEGHGRILLHPLSSELGDTLVTLDPLVPINNHRAVRKLLAMCTSNAVLTLEDRRITSLGRFTAAADMCGFSIQFQGHYIWELSYRGHVLMRTAYGIPGLPRSSVRKAKFAEILKSVFVNQAALEVNALWTFTSRAMRLGHGTSIIISSDAAQEAWRLHGECTPVKPVQIRAEMATHITSIDGGVLMSPLGECHAIGVIMDGRADPDDHVAPHHDASRGSRYNSAVRYVKSATSPTVVVVISDDGMIDMVYRKT